MCMPMLRYPTLLEHAATLNPATCMPLSSFLTQLIHVATLNPAMRMPLSSFPTQLGHVTALVLQMCAGGCGEPHGIHQD